MGDRLYLERLVWFDTQIRRGRSPNASSLARTFECSVKTAQRSIETFRDRYGAPIEYFPARRGYDYVDAAYRLPLTRLSDSEILALLVSRKLLADAAAGVLGEELDKVVARLGTLLVENLSGTMDLDTAFSFRWTAVTPCDAHIFGQTVTALASCLPLSLCYYSPHSNVCTTRTVEPHHLLNYQGAWHVIAWCRLRNDWRDFVLARMSDCRLEADPFARRDASEWLPFLEETFGIFHGRERFEVTLRFSSELARWAKGQRWHPDQHLEERETGELDVILPVSHETEILMEILKYGSKVEVLAPEWLRKRVRKEMKAIAEKYRT